MSMKIIIATGCVVCCAAVTFAQVDEDRVERVAISLADRNVSWLRREHALAIELNSDIARVEQVYKAAAIALTSIDERSERVGISDRLLYFALEMEIEAATLRDYVASACTTGSLSSLGFKCVMYMNAIGKIELADDTMHCLREAAVSMPQSIVGNLELMALAEQVKSVDEVAGWLQCIASKETELPDRVVAAIALAGTQMPTRDVTQAVDALRSSHRLNDPRDAEYRVASARKQRLALVLDLIAEADVRGWDEVVAGESWQRADDAIRASIALRYAGRGDRDTAERIWDTLSEASRRTLSYTRFAGDFAVAATIVDSRPGRCVVGVR